MRWELNEKQVHHYPLFWIAITLAALFVAGLTMNWTRLNRRYQRWNEGQHVQRATASLARGDYAKVIIDARSALDFNRQNVEAIRLIAQAIEAQGSPYSATWRRQLDAIQPGDAENLLALAGLAVQKADWEGAATVLAGIKSADQGKARYHELMAKIAGAKRDQQAAESHWAEALRLDPANDAFRFGLADTQLRAKSATVRRAAQETLETMSRLPSHHLLAQRALINDAWQQGESARLLELATAVAADPAALFTDKLVLLTVLQKSKQAQFAAVLSQMQEAATAQPDEIFQLLTWMNEHYLALLVPEWEARLAPETAAKIPVCVALADACARASNWTKLNEKIETVSWEHLEFLRLAYLARARERSHDPDGTDAAWKKSLTAAQPRPEYLERLAKLMLEWNWPERAEEALWKLSASETCPRWAVEYLWAAALKRKDTAQLCQAAWLKLRLAPKSLAARNNYANLALLIGKDIENARRLALVDYQEAPTDPNIATTYGLALTQQDKAEAALAVMEKFSPEQLQVPTVAIYYGIFLAAAGQTEKSEEFIKLGTDADLLPEEKTLANKATASVPIEAITNIGR